MSTAETTGMPATKTATATVTTTAVATRRSSEHNAGTACQK